MDVTLEAYLRFLSKHPGDVVMAALSETYEWFPDEAELVRRMQRHSEPRRLLMARLRKAAANPPAAHDGASPRPDAAARKRMAELVAKNFTARGAEAEKQRAETDEERDARHEDWAENPVKPSLELVAHVEREERRGW